MLSPGAARRGRKRVGERFMSSPHAVDPSGSQDAVFRFLADPRTHRLAEPVVRIDTADADAAVAQRQRADPLNERGWEAVDASGGLPETIALARERTGRS